MNAPTTILEPAGGRHAVISRESVEHASRRGDRRQPAEAHRDGDRPTEDAAEAFAEILLEDVDDGRVVAEVVLTELGRVVELAEQR
jgi:hypothetical protein